MATIHDKVEKEKRIVNEMITLYCRKKHHANKELCPSCLSLQNYANQRSDVCPFKKTKNFCSNCKVHCYQKDKRIQIKEVMRFAGPRMLLYHPMMVIMHIIYSQREKRKLRKQHEC